MPDPQSILNVVVPGVIGGVAAIFMIWVFYQIFKKWWQGKREDW